MRLRAWAPPAVTFAVLLATYFCIPPNCGVPKYNFGQQLLDPAPLNRQRLYLSVYPEAESNYRIDKKSATVGQLVRDRKSTRLNSSHANISYAVFCLKKKTKF